MKNKIISVVLLYLLIFSTLNVSPIFAQSRIPTEPVPIAPVQGSEIPSEKKIELPQPKQLYEYIAPQPIIEFMLALKEAGKRGFRLDKVTAMPSGEAATIEAKSDKTVLAGLVRFDGEYQFDYNFFIAENNIPPDNRLNGLSRNDWYFRGIIGIFGGGIKENKLFDNSVYELPTLGNLYLLERVVGAESSSTPNYKLLKAGVLLGRKPKEKMQNLLDGAIEDGYVPLASYVAFEVKSIFSVDSFVGVLTGKSGALNEKVLYKFTRANRSSGLQKEIDVLSKQGWRIRSINFNSAILTRETDVSTPVTYQWLRTNEKNFQTALAAVLARNSRFVSTGIDIGYGNTFLKNILIFEQDSTISAKYQFAKMNPVIPKQFKKNPQEYLKTLEPPDAAFKRMLDEGYSPRDLYFSETEGLIVIFETVK